MSLSDGDWTPACAGVTRTGRRGDGAGECGGDWTPACAGVTGQMASRSRRAATSWRMDSRLRGSDEAEVLRALITVEAQIYYGRRGAETLWTARRWRLDSRLRGSDEGGAEPD